MTPRRREQANYAAELAILVGAFVLLGLAFLLLLPMMSSHEGAAVQHMGTPVAALATARELRFPAATPTPLPTATPSSTAVPTPTQPPPTATVVPTPPPPTATAVPTATSLPLVLRPSATAALATGTSTPTPVSGPIPDDTATAVGTTSVVSVTVEGTAAVTGTPPDVATESATPTPGVSALVTATPSALGTAASVIDPAFLAGLVRSVIDLTNQERVHHGLPSLAPDALLNRIATKRSQDMIDRDYFNHYDPATHQPAVVELLDSMVVPYHEVGENIVENRNMPLDSATPAQVVAALMASKEHRDNILDSTYSNIGVGVAVAQEGGAFRVVFTQVFLS